MQLAQIHAFLAVADSESFSLAAERLHLTQPAVSKRIRQLELELRTELFDRIGKRSLLTPNGRAFKPHAERILHELAAFRTGLSRQLDTPSGSLRFATSHHIGLHRLPPVLREFRIRFPLVELDLNFMDSEDACAAVLANDLELAVVTLPEAADDRLACEPVWIDRLVVVLAVDHPLVESGTLDLAALLEHPAILPSRGTFTRRIIDRTFAGAEERLRVALETNYLETIKVMVAANLGWSLLPLGMVDATLRGIPLGGTPLGGAPLDVRRPLGIVTHRERTLSLSSSAMIGLLRERAEASRETPVNHN